MRGVGAGGMAGTLPSMKSSTSSLVSRPPGPVAGISSGSRFSSETNLRTAYAAGRWERIERLAPRLPWLRCSAVLDERTRPEHAAWHGIVLPANDPFWSTHYPPNGWG